MTGFLAHTRHARLVTLAMGHRLHAPKGLELTMRHRSAPLPKSLAFVLSAASFVARPAYHRIPALGPMSTRVYLSYHGAKVTTSIREAPFASRVLGYGRSLLLISAIIMRIVMSCFFLPDSLLGDKDE